MNPVEQALCELNFRDPEQGRALAATLARDRRRPRASARVGHKVGVHFATEDKGRTRYLCARLAERGFCTGAKKEAVVAWPGVDTERLWKRDWPRRFERYLDHVKIACAADGVRKAKAYLGVAPCFSLLG